MIVNSQYLIQPNIDTSKEKRLIKSIANLFIKEYDKSFKIEFESKSNKKYYKFENVKFCLFQDSEQTHLKKFEIEFHYDNFHLKTIFFKNLYYLCLQLNIPLFKIERYSVNLSKCLHKSYKFLPLKIIDFNNNYSWIFVDSFKFSIIEKSFYADVERYLSNKFNFPIDFNKNEEEFKKDVKLIKIVHY